MHEVTERVQNASQHPHVSLKPDLILEEGVYHLRCSIHRCCVLLHFVGVFVVVAGGHIREIDGFIGAGAEVTDFVVTITAYQDVLNFYVAMSKPNRMNSLNAPCYTIQYLQQFWLSKASVLSFYQLIEEGPSFAQFHQQHDCALA